MNNITVSSWDELNDRLFEDSWKEQLGRLPVQLCLPGHGQVFRGSEDRPHAVR